MKPSRMHVNFLMALFALVMMSAAAMAADPGLIYAPQSEASDQKAGSLLIYNFYTSSSLNQNVQNTKINLTNTSTSSAAFVHIFFVSESCSVADYFTCLTANQTYSILASDYDPDFSGYIVMVAVSGITGCPVAFNHLMGDESIKFNDYIANLGAVAFSALFEGTLPGCDANSTFALLNFTGGYGGYNLVPATLVVDSIPSPKDGNSTLLILNRIGGNLALGTSTLGTLFGLLFNDTEDAYSFSITGGCQLRGVLSNTFPRTAPRYENVIPAGRTGWMKIYSQTGTIGMLGAIMNFNPNARATANAFNGGHNLHHKTLTTASYTIPVFAPTC